MMILVCLEAVTPPSAQPSLWLTCKLQICFTRLRDYVSPFVDLMGAVNVDLMSKYL